MNKLSEYSTSRINIAPDAEQRAKNAYIISVGTATLLSLLLILTILVNRSLTTDPVALITLTLGAIAFGASAYLSRHGKSNNGILLNIAVLTIIVVSRVFIQRGLALPIGIVYIVLVSSMAIYTLPPIWVGRTVVISFIAAIFTIIADQYTVAVPKSPYAIYVTWISIIVGGGYLFIIATQFQHLSLRVKLILGFLFLAIAPLILLGWQTYSTTQDIVRGQIKADILRSSLLTSGEISDFLSAQFSTMHDQARLTEIVEYMSLPESERRGSQQELLALNRLTALSKEKPIYIISYALVDKNGTDLLDTNRSNAGTNYAQYDFFKYVTDKQLPYASGLTILPEGERSLYLATPILTKSGDPLGVFVLTLSATVVHTTLEQLVRDSQIPTTTEYTYVIDGTNFFVLGHASRANLLYKTYLDKDDDRLTSLIQQGILTQNDIDAMAISRPDIVSELSNTDSRISFHASSEEYGGELAEASAIRLRNSNWIVVTAQPDSTIDALTQNQTRTTVILSVIITSLAAVIALIASNFFTNPIIQLTRVAEKISTGDFSQKADAHLKDETGVLARTFNTMTDQIQGLIENLEKRVEQRTSELEQATIQSEKRATDFQTIAEIAQNISIEKDLAKLLPLITRIVSERFSFYHVGVFLLDEKGKFAILRAANSPGGQIMLRRQHKLEVGQTGIVGNVTSTGVPRIVLDTGSDAIYFNNPDLPETRSEMALPLIARGVIIGALDVQSTISNAFTDTDISVISLLANQVAVAIDNVRLLEEAQNSLAESQSIFREYLAEAWQKKSTSAVLGYYQTLAGGKLITTNKDRSDVIEPASTNGTPALVIPIQVRDQVIGMLNVRPNNEDRTWSKDEINIIEAVAERLGLALDNARLFEETSTRASRERLVSDITTKIRGTNDPQEMVRTAVEELQRALGASRIEVVPQKIAPPPDK